MTKIPTREDIEAAIVDLRRGLNSSKRDDEIAQMLGALADERDELRRELELALDRAADHRPDVAPGSTVRRGPGPKAKGYTGDPSP